MNRGKEKDRGTVQVPPCEECGQPASVFVRDFFRIERPMRTCLFKYEPRGEVHAFCSEHARDAEQQDVVLWD